MDSDVLIRRFEAIEQKVEKLLEALRSLEQTNSKLNEKILTVEGELQGKVAAEQRLIEERELIRSRIDKLLARLADASDT